MYSSVEKQILHISHDPIFFKKEIPYLRKLLAPEETLLGFIDGWIENLQLDGTAFITSQRLIVMSFNKEEFVYDELSWKSLVKIKSDIRQSISGFTFISPFKSIHISEIESPYLSRQFYTSIKNHLNSSTLKGYSPSSIFKNQLQQEIQKRLE